MRRKIIVTIVACLLLSTRIGAGIAVTGSNAFTIGHFVVYPLKRKGFWVMDMETGKRSKVSRSLVAAITDVTNGL